jgi:glycosyltransferase involved in cell wall biosynthesis
LRILLATHLFPPAHRGGVETHVAALAPALSRAGAEIAVVTTEEARGSRVGTVESELAPFGTLYRIGHDRRARTPLETLDREEVRLGFRAVLAAARPEIVHFEHLMYLGLGAPDEARAFGIPSLLTLHEYWLFCARNGQLLRPDGVRCQGPDAATCARCLSTFRFGRSPLEAALAPWLRALDGRLGTRLFRGAKRWGRRAAPERLGESLDPALGTFLRDREARVRRVFEVVELVLCPSRFLERLFAAQGLGLGKLRYWPNGILAFRGTRAVDAPAGGPLRVGFLGSLVPAKGPDVLVRAAGRLPAGRVRVRLHGSLDADPGYVAGLRRLARSVDVEFRGPYSPEDRDSILRELDAVVVPSMWFENAPLVIFEAASAGLAIAGSDHGGVAEWTRATGRGELFAPGDDAALAGILDRWASLGLPPRPATPPPLRTIAEEASSLLDLYEGILGAKA